MINNAGANRIEFYVSIAREHISRRLDNARAESAFPKRARSFMASVEVRDVAPTEVAH
jgi:hypothetical protein